MPHDSNVIDEILEHNRRTPPGSSARPSDSRPARHLAVLTCMDTRIDPYQTLGLAAGDAHIIRNAGGIVTDDALRSLILSHHALGTREIMVINHTDCGLMKIADETFIADMETRTGRAAVAPATFQPFTDLYTNIRRQVNRIRSHPWLGEKLLVRGFVYDVATGKLREVESN